MLITNRLLERIEQGEVTLLFRRWRAPRAVAGARHRTQRGLLEIVAVARVDDDAITDADAREAGFKDAASLRARLAKVPEGDVYRMTVRHGGADPRVALRTDEALDDWDMLERRIARLDRRPTGPWVADVLALIGANEAVLAADLAAGIGRERAPFKLDVRRLKELGLTGASRWATGSRRGAARRWGGWAGVARRWNAYGDGVPARVQRVVSSALVRGVDTRGTDLFRSTERPICAVA